MRLLRTNSVIQLGEEFFVLYNVKKLGASYKRKEIVEKDKVVATTDYYPCCYVTYNDNTCSEVIILENNTYNGIQAAKQRAIEIIQKQVF